MRRAPSRSLHHRRSRGRNYHGPCNAMRTSWIGIILVLGASIGCSNNPTEHPYKIHSLYGVSDPQIARTMGSMLGPTLVGGNSVTTLVNGDQIFPPMLEAIRSAEQTICFETFIYWSGNLGAQFAAALAD